MDFLTDNLRGPDLGDATRELILATQPSGSIEETSDGWPYLVLPTAERHIVDAPLGYGALEQLASERGAQVVLFGLGVGHAARAVRGTGARLCFIYEPDPGVVRHYLERGPNDLAGTRIVSDLSELEQSWSSLVFDSSKLQLLDTPGYAQAQPAARRELTDMISNLLERKVVNDKTFRSRGRAWIGDIIDNARFMSTAPSALFLQGAFQGVPAFIVGAGPSLEKNVHLLHEARGKGIVFAVNASGGALDRAGVAPQIWSCIESLDLSHLLGELSYKDTCLRLLSLAAHPNLFRTGAGPLLTMYELLPQFARPLENFFGKSAVPVCGSVTTAMVALAQRMGCSPIVLVGQDLAYTDGRAYSKDTAYVDNRLEFAPDGATVRHHRRDALLAEGSSSSGAERVERVMGWGGAGTVVSTMSFGHVRVWLERFAAIVSKLKSPPRLINATEGGSSIEGFEEVPLADVLPHLELLGLEPEDIAARATSRGPSVTLEKVGDFLLLQAQGARAVASAAGRLGESSRKALAYWEKAPADVLRGIMDELAAKEKELRSAVHAWPWVDTWAWSEVDAVVQEHKGSAEADSALVGVEHEVRLALAIETAALNLASKLERQAAELIQEVRVSA